MEEVAGPWGGDGGSPWDDGRDVGGVKEIILEHSQCIHSFTVVYNHNGASVNVRHGAGHVGTSTDTSAEETRILLHFPEEYLIGVAGFAANFDGMYVIRSLTFTTNKVNHAPIGVEGGDFFYWTAAKHGDKLHISSFSGRSGLYLDAIGFRLSPLPQAQANAHARKPLMMIQISKTTSNEAEAEGEGRLLSEATKGRPDDEAIRCSGCAAFNKPVAHSRRTDEGRGRRVNNEQTKSKVQEQKSEERGVEESKIVIKVGPWGGQSGHIWDDENHDEVREIQVSHNGQYIEFIRVVYGNMGKCVICQHGGEGNNSTTKVNLAYPMEFLMGVSGYIGELDNSTVIRSLRFKSNIATYGPFGVEAGIPFQFSTERYCQGVRIVGFSGVSGKCMEAIGFNLCRPQQPRPTMTIHPSENDSRLTNKKKKMVMGPWGGKGGKSWDDGTYDGVREITVAHDDNCICSIHVVYDDNGCDVSCLHGGVRGSSRTTIKLEYPKEYLTSISGYVGRVSGLLVLRSLTFKSNYKRTMETLRIPNGTYFSSETDKYGNGFRITGFFGRSGFYIDEIGVHISPTQNLGGGICKTIRQMVRNVGRMACTSPSQGDGDDTEAQTESVPV